MRYMKYQYILKMFWKYSRFLETQFAPRLNLIKCIGASHASPIFCLSVMYQLHFIFSYFSYFSYFILLFVWWQWDGYKQIFFQIHKLLGTIFFKETISLMCEITKMEGEEAPAQRSYKRHLQLVISELKLYEWNNLDINYKLQGYN